MTGPSAPGAVVSHSGVQGVLHDTIRFACTLEEGLELGCLAQDDLTSFVWLESYWTSVRLGHLQRKPHPSSRGAGHGAPWGGLDCASHCERPAALATVSLT